MGAAGNYFGVFYLILYFDTVLVILNILTAQVAAPLVVLFQNGPFKILEETSQPEKQKNGSKTFFLWLTNLVDSELKKQDLDNQQQTKEILQDKLESNSEAQIEPKSEDKKENYRNIIYLPELKLRKWMYFFNNKIFWLFLSFHIILWLLPHQ